MAAIIPYKHYKCPFCGTLTNSTDPNLEQSDLDLHCLSKRLHKNLCRRRQQTIFVVIGVLRLNKCEFSVLRSRFSLNACTLARLKKLINSLRVIKRTGFPLLSRLNADEIAQI